MRLHIHVAATAVLFDAMRGNPELLSVLSARRNPEHDPLVVERLDLDPRAEERLRQVDRDDADQIESLATEEAIRRNVDLDDKIAAAFGPLIPQADARAFFDPGGDVDVDPLLDPHFAAALVTEPCPCPDTRDRADSRRIRPVRMTPCRAPCTPGRC